jgi:hypothetical protein
MSPEAETYPVPASKILDEAECASILDDCTMTHTMSLSDCPRILERHHARWSLEEQRRPLRASNVEILLVYLRIKANRQVLLADLLYAW